MITRLFFVSSQPTDKNIIMTKERYTIRVDGKVQGVWFRKHTAEKAKSLGLNGMVQNEEGGSVYIEAEGSREDLTSLVTWCLDGSDQSNVQGITLVRVPIIGYSSFEIK